MRLVLSICLGLILSVSYGQRESFHWYFGDHAGLLFTDNGVSAVTDGEMNTTEGCATISDSTGKLLFYTDGSRIWNSNHQVMEDGLNGNQSSTQAAVIVANPADVNKYFVFTTDGVVDGLQYTEVNMSLNGGLGDVTPTIKNRVLLKNSLEKVTAIKHPNQVEYWLIGHKKSSSAFHVYKITADGNVVNTGVYNIGHSPAEGVGYMKVSPNGRNVAIAHALSGVVEILDFDGKDGTLSNLRSVDNLNPQAPYGLEFSSDGAFLYVSTTRHVNDTSYLYQYFLGGNEIAPSKEIVYEYFGNLGALQLGADGRLYAALGNSEYLGVIEKPNEVVPGCNFSADGVYLEGMKCRLGLPGFIQSYFIDADFVYEGNCSNRDINFYSLAKTADSVRWDFGDPSSGALNSSTATQPVHRYAIEGVYTVKLTIYTLGETDSYSEILSILPSPDFELGPDSFYCDRASLDLYIPHDDATIAWNDDEEDKGQYKTVEFDGSYWAVVEREGCTASDTIQLSFYDTPNEPLVELQACFGDPTLLEVLTEKSSYLWDNGDANKYIYASSTGIYSAEVSNPCGIDTAVFDLTYVDCNCVAHVPNAVSANADGKNDLFRPTFNCELELSDYRFVVYNRWGQIVFSSTDLSEAFDPSTVDGSFFIWTLDFSSDAYTNNVSSSLSGVLHVLN